METPKNIRQIGENNTNHHIYIEDYVITYLQQIAEDMEYGSRAILLLGHTEEKEEESCYYISGAVASQKKRIDRNEFIFDEMDKEYLLEKKSHYFSELKILGWAVIENEFNKVYEESAWCESGDEFNGENKLFCKISSEYNEKKWYLNKNGIIKQIHGYAIFYDQNEKMQNFLILWHKDKQQSGTEEVSDRAAKRFRSLAIERNDFSNGRHASSFFYIVCIFFFMVVSVMGITSINQYDKMIAVENAMLELAQAMKENDTLTSEAVAVMQTRVQEEKQIADEDMETGHGDADDIDAAPTNSAEVPETDTSAVDINPEADNIQEGDAVDTKTAETNSQDLNSGDANAEVSNMEGTNTEEQNTNIEESGAEEIVTEISSVQEGNAETDNEANASESGSVAQTDSEELEIYYVQEGDTLAEISYRKYQTIKRVPDICAVNQIKNPNNIVVGEKILLP